MRRKEGRAAGLQATSEALTSWRQRFGGRGRRIPDALWAGAVEVARSGGVAQTARALRLDARKLAARVEPALATAENGSSTFVELGGLDVLTAREPLVVHFIGREGDQVRIEVPPDAVGGGGLVALARAFWSRGT